jgi:hypothetical protein
LIALDRSLHLQPDRYVLMSQAQDSSPQDSSRQDGSPQVSPHEHAVGERRPFTAAQARLFILLLFHVATCCLSLVAVSQFQPLMPFQREHLAYAVALVSAFSLVSALFVFARFSFGYFAGFYLYTQVAGFLWLSSFSILPYDTELAAASAAVSTILFLLPALFIDAPVRQILVLSRQNFERLLFGILLLSLATIAAGASYNFKLVSLSHIYEFRDDAQFPTALRYLAGIVPNALLPFAFASYLALRSYRKAGVTLLLFPLFYPILLSKLIFFTPAWILVLLAASRILSARLTVVLSLFVPLTLGTIMIATLAHEHAYPFFNIVNIRMMATPSSALDIYNDFFAHHPHTWFCQVSIVQRLASCPYHEQLAVVMQNTYNLGNLNASLFATEGVASVGPYLAPLVALACGLVVAIGNRLSAGLPPRFVLLSGAILPQVLLNVPLTITMLTYGAGLLFVLWYLTPRSIFEPA